LGADAATAKKMVGAAEAAAIALNAPMAIAVVDGNGDLVYFERMDGAGAGCDEYREKRGRTASRSADEILRRDRAGKPIL
jgi:uncharacterized protein GlcG (DUF336 family)